jgi:hypothetical protein
MLEDALELFPSILAMPDMITQCAMSVDGFMEASQLPACIFQACMASTRDPISGRSRGSTSGCGPSSGGPHARRVDTPGGIINDGGRVVPRDVHDQDIERLT